MNYDIDYCKKYEPVFGAWQIKKKLGEGNFGAVFEIEREDFGTKYHAALKVISIPKNNAELESIMNETMDESATGVYLEQVVERIVKEFELMAKLKGNSNVVSYEDHQVIKHETDAGWDILIRMELLTPMLTYFKTKTVTRKDVINLGIDICKALELCQKHNIIHRDIKPENIFVSESGDFKLGDFGIAKQVEEAQSELTKIGTPTYMAPEVVKGDPYDNSVDMYSLGVVLYRFLNHNRIPFMPQYPEPIDYTCKDKAFGERINSGKPFPPPSNSGSTELSNIIIKACSYNPRERYLNPAQFRKALEGILSKESDSVLSVQVGMNAGEGTVKVTGMNTSVSKVSAAPVTKAKPSSKPAPAADDAGDGYDDYEKTSLIQSLDRYTVDAGDTMVMENTTKGPVTLTRDGDEPIEIIITAKTGENTSHSPWKQNEITLNPGEKLTVKNTSEKVILFYSQFGAGQLSAEQKTTEKKKILPIIGIAVAIVAVVAIAVVALLGGNDEEPVIEPDPIIYNEPEIIEEEVPTEIAGIPADILLQEGEIYELAPEIPEEDKQNGSIIYTSDNKTAAAVGSDGSIIAMTSGDANISVRYKEVEQIIAVKVVNLQALRDGIAAILDDAEARLDVIEKNREKDISSLKERINNAEQGIEYYRNMDLSSADAHRLLELTSLVKSEIISVVEAIEAELPGLPEAKKCAVCGSTAHLSHPRCSYCGSTSHTVHPACSYCGSNDHGDAEHPRCSYCGSTSHTDHPKCNICGSLEHAVHPAISVDL